MTVNENADASFESLGLNEDVLAAVADLGYEQPTPVQAAAIPEALQGRDVLAAAQTGTGKTAAFLLPCLNDLVPIRVSEGKRGSAGQGPHMLVVTPTRELAQQIEDVCVAVSKRTGHVSATVVGGVGYNPQRNALRAGCDVLIATPGRLIDLMDQGDCQLDQVEKLVLDEADRMLDMGFLPAIRKIVAAVPDSRQTLLFSATLDESAVGSITHLVTDPVRVEIAPATSTSDSVEQYVLPVSLEAKNSLLAEVLKQAGAKRVIVFTRTKHRADACRRRLVRAGFSCAVIHGDRSQNQRQRALDAFKAGDIDVLVATDVLSRGIDVQEVSYVVNFDVPADPVDYIHRIGRTGRGGDEGWSLTFVTEQDLGEFLDIEALMGKTVSQYPTRGLDVGEEPVYLDPLRIPASKPAGKKAKKRRNAKQKQKAASSSTTAARPRAERASGLDERTSGKGKRKRVASQSQRPSEQPGKQRSKKKPSGTGSQQQAQASLRPGVRSSGIRNGGSSSKPNKTRTRSRKKTNAQGSKPKTHNARRRPNRSDSKPNRAKRR